MKTQQNPLFLDAEAALDKVEAQPRRWKRYPHTGRPVPDWLGKLPSHWSLKKLKFLAQLVTTKAEDEALKVGLEHIESFTGRFLDIEAKYQGEGIGFQPDDILYGKLRPYLAKVMLALSAGAAVGDFFVLRPGAEVVPTYVQFVLLERGFTELADGSTFGAKMPRVDWRFLGSLRFPLPPLPEQRAIAAFLRRETAKIDALVEKKRRLIDILKEKRTALISHAVTKGLNPDAVTMKASGFDWIGEIPQHWVIHHLRRVVRKFIDYRGRTPEKSAGGVPLITAGAIKDGIIDHSLAPEYIPAADYEDWMGRGRPAIGDVVITTEAPLGEVAQVRDDTVAFAQRVILFKVNRDRMLPEFLRLYYLCINGKSELLTRASGSTASGIRADRLKRSLVVTPPIHEQRAIVDYLESRVAQLEAPQARILNAIERLNEYRSALISAAVTGKIDVRDEVAE